MGNLRNKTIWECPQCDYKNSKKFNVTRHIRLKHVEYKYACTDCDFKTKRKRNLELHMRRHDSASVGTFNCGPCKVEFENKQMFQWHLNDQHPEENSFKERPSKRAFDGQEREYSRTLKRHAVDASILKLLTTDFVNLSKKILAQDFNMFTCNIIMESVFERESGGEVTDIDVFPLKTQAYKIKSNTNFKRVLSDAILELDESVDELKLTGM